MSHLFLSLAAKIPAFKPSPGDVFERTADEVQELLGNCSHQLPEDSYFEDFLEEFHLRQRKELLHRSSWSLCRDRTGTWLSGLNQLRVFGFFASLGALGVLAVIW